MEHAEPDHIFDSDPVQLAQGWVLVDRHEGPKGAVLRVARSGDRQRSQWVIATGTTLAEAIQMARMRIELFEGE